MRVSIRLDPEELRRGLAADHESLISGVTMGMTRGAEIAKQMLRDDVRGAGLGDRISRAVRGVVYPKGKRSLTPALYMHNASVLLDYFHDDNVIQARGGGWIAIPTEAAERLGYASTDVSRKGNAVPAGQSRRLARIDLASREWKLGTRLIGNGNLLLVGEAPIKGGRARANTAANRRGRAGNTAKQPQGKAVVLFILVKQARVSRRLQFGQRRDAISKMLAEQINRALGGARLAV